MKTFFLFICTFISFTLKAQDSLIFQRLTEELKNFKPDTSNVPNDRTTKKINELRSLRGGFNINEAIAYKIAEDISKEPEKKNELEKLKQSFETGNGKRWLDNAVTWIYRKEFTYKELKQMVRFYKTKAGQKFAKAAPFLMLKSLAAGETVKQLLTQ